MQAIQDWLCYFNDFDVAPGVKDAVSIPGVSIQLVLCRVLSQRANLWSPNKVAYDILKAAVVSGPSLVFTQYHKAGVTKVQSRQSGQKVCTKVLGYNANVLYLLTMAKVCHAGMGLFKSALTLEILHEPRPRFEEMWLVFVNKEIPEEAVLAKMKQYLSHTK